MIKEQAIKEQAINESGRVWAARWIIPVSRDPINGGWIRIEHGRIAEIGAGTPPAGAQDLGDVALLPGLINAHGHLILPGRVPGESMEKERFAVPAWVVGNRLRRLVDFSRISIDSRIDSVGCVRRFSSRGGCL